MIYLALFGTMVFMRYALMNTQGMRTQLYAPLLFLVFLFSAFRFEVGCDWSGYLNQYFVYGQTPFSEIWSNREAVWVGLFSLQTWLDLPYPWINVFSSLIFFAGLYAMAKRQPDPLSFLILMFPILIINMPMSGIRQGAAIGVMFFALNAFNDRALLRYVSFTLLAAAIHSSAIVFLLLAPLVTGKYSQKRMLLSGLLAIPGALILISGEAAEVAFARYVDTGTEAYGAMFRVGLLTLSGLYFLTFLKRKWQQQFPVDFRLAMIGSIFMALLILILPLSSVIADRLAYYMIPIQVMIFARIPYFASLKNRSLHTAFPYFLIGTTFVAWTSMSALFQQCYVPYQSWLLGFPSNPRFLF